MPEPNPPRRKSRGSEKLFVLLQVSDALISVPELSLPPAISRRHLQVREEPRRLAVELRELAEDELRASALRVRRLALQDQHLRAEEAATH